MSEIIKFRFRLVNRCKQRTGFLIESFPFGGQCQVIFRAGKKIDGKFFLQFPDGTGDRRLCDIQLLGSLRDTVVAADGAEIF